MDATKEIRIETEQRMCTFRYLVVDGERYSIRSVIETLEELEGCDGLFTSLVINFDDRLAAMLVKQGAAVQTTRGGYREGANRASFLARVEALL